MSSCLLPTIQLLQPTTTNPVLRPTLVSTKPQPSSPPQQQKRRRKPYPLGHSSSSPSRFPKMRLPLLRTSALCSLLGLSSAQSSTWAQTQPFDVDVSTESLLSSVQQPLTNVVASSTPSTTALAPVATVTGEFSTTIPSELSAASSRAETSVLVVSSGGSAASESSASASSSASLSSNSAASRATSSATVQSTGAAAPHRMMGVAGALAGAAGVLFV